MNDRGNILTIDYTVPCNNKYAFISGLGPIKKIGLYGDFCPPLYGPFFHFTEPGTLRTIPGQWLKNLKNVRNHFTGFVKWRLTEASRVKCTLVKSPQK